jgi:hypothetical protein
MGVRQKPRRDLPVYAEEGSVGIGPLLLLQRPKLAVEQLRLGGEEI